MGGHKMIGPVSAIISLVAGWVTSSPVFAQNNHDAAVRAYWTPARLRDAIPMERHPANVGPDGLPAAVVTTQHTSLVPLTSGPSLAPLAALPASQLGHLPTEQVPDGGVAYSKSSKANGVIPKSTAFGYEFTTSRVFPSTTQVQNYPYRTTGHLFFTITQSGGIDPPGNYQCTASVIKARIVVTAGHCVGSPKKATGGHFFWYSNWLFIPADTNGAAPYGKWTVFAYGASGPWSTGTGSVPNSEDWGMLAMNDNANVKIGNATGTLGYFTYSTENDITALGYPANLDNGGLMQYNTGTAVGGSAGTWVIGSAMAAGASGGPWIIDFGQAPSCSGSCLSPNNLGSNYIVAVNSYYPTNTVGYYGASQFNNDWITLLNLMCAKKVGSC
jgi:hypothetical protein